MGGAIAIHLAYKAILKDLQGLIILDVVEGKKKNFVIPTQY
jgi:hypothetical protein